MCLIRDAIKVAREYYEDSIYQHAMRVAAYVTNDNLIPEHKKDDCVVLAVMHDLLEDTEFDISSFDTDCRIKECLHILTKDPGTTYEEYIKHIKDDYPYHPEAYWVKVADICDQKDEQQNFNQEVFKQIDWSKMP